MRNFLELLEKVPQDSLENFYRNSWQISPEFLKEILRIVLIKLPRILKINSLAFLGEIRQTFCVKFRKETLDTIEKNHKNI